MITESRPSSFGAQVAKTPPQVAITVGNLSVEGQHLAGDCTRQLIDTTRAVVSSDRVRVTLNPDDGSGTLSLPHVTKSFQLGHCVLIGAKTKGSFIDELDPTAAGEVVTLMLWAQPGTIIG